MADRKNLKKILSLGLLLGLLLNGCLLGKDSPPVGEIQLQSALSVTEGNYTDLLFTPKEPFIDATLKGSGFRPGDLLAWTWQLPDRSTYLQEMRRVFGPQDQTRLALAGTKAATQTGRWTLTIRRQQTVVAEKSFMLVNDKDQWQAVNADHPNQRSGALLAVCQKGDIDFLLGHFSFSISPHDRSLIMDCLKGDYERAVPVLEEALAKAPADETLLVIAYQLKEHLLTELRGDRLPPAKFQQLFLAMVRPWDAELLKNLLTVEEKPEMRILACRMIGATRSPLVPLLLRPALAVAQPVAVRSAAVEVLLRPPQSLATRAILFAHLSAETDPALRESILQSLGAHVAPQ